LITDDQGNAQGVRLWRGSRSRPTSPTLGIRKWLLARAFFMDFPIA
jgi:hypothetical protein